MQYTNLRAEMARKGVTVSKMAEVLGFRYATLNEKLNGRKRIYLDEARLIRSEFFPEHPLEYLFGDSEQSSGEEIAQNETCASSA